MDEQFLYDFRTGCGNSAKFVRFFDMGFRRIMASHLEIMINFQINFREK